ncbi:hypothetical protein OAV30_00405 [Candidatus Pelagibacter sp.]|nr:hypothetical protein [Candidatus Pelagibacter sp.]
MTYNVIQRTSQPHENDSKEEVGTMNPETKLWKLLKKNTPEIKWSRIESWAVPGIPDLLGYHDSCGFFTVELKVTTTKKVRFSPHQILFHSTHTKRNFILVQQTEKASSRSIKLYGSTSILGLLTDVRETPCLALDDWSHIQRLMLNAPLA